MENRTEINKSTLILNIAAMVQYFSSVGRVNGNGNSTKEITYTFTHSNLTAATLLPIGTYDLTEPLNIHSVLLSRTKGAQLRLRLILLLRL
jgi:hypothetical protein